MKYLEKLHQNARKFLANARRALATAAFHQVLFLSLTVATQAVKSATYFEYEGVRHSSAAEACEAVAKARRADRSNDNPYGRVVASRDAGDSFWCKLGDRSGNETEQHYGRKVMTHEKKVGGDAAESASEQKPSSTQPPGKWADVERSKGEWLAVQSKVSGQKITSLGAETALIKEYYLDGEEFDGYKPGALYEVKGDYAGLGWKLASLGKAESEEKMKKKEAGFVAQAKKLVTTAKKYGLKPIYVVKSDQREYWKRLLGGRYPEIEWQFWDRGKSKEIIYPSP